jgi:hypothetical protein
MTVTSAQEIEVVDLLSHLEEDRPCTPWEVDCNKSATWIATGTTCCDVELPLCDEHKQCVLAWIALLKAYGDGLTIMCKACGTSGISLDPSSYTWTKIKGC